MKRAKFFSALKSQPALCPRRWFCPNPVTLLGKVWAGGGCPEKKAPNKPTQTTQRARRLQRQRKRPGSRNERIVGKPSGSDHAQPPFS